MVVVGYYTRLTEFVRCIYIRSLGINNVKVSVSEFISLLQVWEVDPETMTKQLIIDVDPLVLSNDPALHSLLDSLYSTGGVVRTQTGVADVFRTLLQWTGFILLKMLEVGVEILT